MTTIAPEAQRNLEMSLSMVKIEVEEEVGCIDLEQSDCRSYMYKSDPLELSENLNYHDSKDHVMKEVKKELLEDEFLPTGYSINSKNSYTALEPTNQPEYVNNNDSKSSVLEQLNNEIPDNKYHQSNYNIRSKFVLEDINLSTLVNGQKGHSVNKGEELPINLMKDNQVSIKIEKIEEQDILHNAGNTNMRYDVLVTPQEANCKFCGRKFKNSFNLIQHNTEHIAVVINRTDINEINESHQSQDCDKHFDNFEVMLSQVSDVHTKKQVKGEVNTNNEKFQCEYCGNMFKVKGDLARHKKIMHYKYDNFKCWCGKLFSSSTQLNEHNSLQHQCDMNDKSNAKFSCDSCPKTFAKKRSLSEHKKRVHYEYGRAFICWCGKEFRTPMQLYEHKKRHPVGKNINNAYNRKFQCEYCQKYIKSKRSLLGHIENVHLNNARAFENRCRKKIRDSLRSQRDGNSKDTSVNKLQCDYCQKFFKRKRSLVIHIRGSHYDYGKKMFKCRCGKRYRSPLHLYWHKIRSHKQDNAKHQNDFKSESLSIRHIESNRYDSGKVFECWCGKQFRSLKPLLGHKKRQHKGNIKDTS